VKNWTITLIKLAVCLVVATGCSAAKATHSIAPPGQAAAVATQAVPARQATLPATEAPAVTTTQAARAGQATRTNPAQQAVQATQPATVTPAAANGQRARHHLDALAGEIGARPAGSPQEVQAGEYIRAALQADGYETQVQPFSFDGQNGSGRSANIIALKAGRSPQEIIVGAHYDSVTAGHGADDNASGVAVMLEVAEKISQVETPYTVRFIAFGSEEVDLDGSRHYARQMSQAEIANTRGMINLDSLAAGDIPYVYGQSGTADSLSDWIANMAGEAGYTLETRTAEELVNADGSPCDCSDYSPFEKLGIPFAYFEATNWNLGDQDGYTQVDPSLGEDGEIWHTRYDKIEQIEALFPGRIDQHLALFVTVLYDTLTRLE
jgi:alkaline phosphatase isozyme conversion protein